MILDAFSLQGKVAVVSGCDTGLGQGMALGLAEAGCDIVGINIVEPTETIERVTALGRRFLSLTADLRKIDAIPELLDRAVAEFGHIDILVNNAGLIRREDAINFSETDWDDVINLNIKSVFFMSQAAAKHFIAQGKGGKIINIASMLSFQGGIRVPSYTASKSAVMGVTRLLANEWAQHNINVNAIAPGYMATNNTQQLRADEERSAAILEIPCEKDGALELAKRSRGTPRIANRLLKRIRDFAQVIGDGVITRDIVSQSLNKLEIDELGLDLVDRRMLEMIITNYNGGPVGLETLAAALGEESVTLEDVYEPYLMQLGFLARTPRGRCANALAYQHLGIVRDGQQMF